MVDIFGEDPKPTEGAPAESKRKIDIFNDEIPAASGAGTASTLSGLIPEKPFLGSGTWGDLGLDVAKSAGIGVAKVGVDIAGMPGEIGAARKQENINRDKPVDTGDPFEAAAQRQRAAVVRRQGVAPPEDREGFVATPENIQQGIESVTGPFYKPQSGLGEVTKYGVNAALTPGGVMRRTAAVVGPAAGEYLGRGFGGEEGAAIGATLGSLPTAFGATKGKLPPRSELIETGGKQMSQARGFADAIKINPADLETEIAAIKQRIEHFGLPSTFSREHALLDELGGISERRQVTGTDILNTLQPLAKLSNSPAGFHARDMLEQFFERSHPAAGGILDHWDEGRANIWAGKGAQDLDAVLQQAWNRAKSAGKGTNIENSIRSRARALLEGRKGRFLPDEVKDGLQDVVRGGSGGNLFRKLGMFAANGIVSLAGTELIAKALNAPATVLIALGQVSKKVGEEVTIAKQRKLERKMIEKSPLAQSMAPKQPKIPRIPLTPPISAAISQE